MHADSLQSLQNAVDQLSPLHRNLLTILALSGPVGISRLSDLADMAGMRETPTRKFSTSSLRGPISNLIEGGLVVQTPMGYVCGSARYPVLRLAANRGTLDALALSLKPLGAQRFGSFEALDFDLHLALAKGAPTVEALLDQLTEQKGATAVTAEWIFPALKPFNARWFSGLPRSLQVRLATDLLVLAEVNGLPIDDFCTYLSDHLETFAASIPPPGLSAWAGVSILNGNSALARRIAAHPSARSVAIATLGAVAASEGRYDDALNHYSKLGKRVASTGVSGLFHTLCLLRRASVDDLELAKRFANAGTRKGGMFRATYSVFKSMVEAIRSSGLAQPTHDYWSLHGEEDCFHWVAQGLYLLWFKVPGLDVGAVANEFSGVAEGAAALQQHWLASQLTELSARLRAKAAGGRPETAATSPSLADMRSVKSAWEVTLEGLERLASTTSSHSPTKREADERIVWHVAPQSLWVEPFLQKCTARKWSQGRKLALKHLQPGSDVLARLPAEDAALSVFVREEREMSGPYSHTRHFFDPKVWVGLVGHPRVVIQGDVAPTEVVRGTVQLVASANQSGLVLIIEPNDLIRNLEIRTEGGRLVVYAMDEAQQSLRKLIGAGLSIPAAGRERAVEALSRLAQIMHVQSTDQTSARCVPGDGRPWFRLVPKAGGLSLSLSVRPLGREGPILSPGRGAASVIGRFEGEVVQASRDLESERALAQQAVLACAVLIDFDPADGTLEIDDPEQCLELVSSLRAQEHRIHVEWPKGVALRLRARVTRASLKGSLKQSGDYFFASGSISVDADLSLALEELLAFITEQPGKFVRLGSGEYLELENELREVLEAVASAREESHAKKGVTALPKSGITALARLTEEGAGFALDKHSVEWRERFAQAFAQHFTVPRALTAEMRSYQVDGFRWLARLAELELGACLADDMGLGKTIQVLALLLHRAKTGPALVVAPTSVCDNWCREALRFAPSLVIREYSGPNREKALRKLGKGNVVVTSYALLQHDSEKLQSVEWATAVLDEAQFIKNAETLRAKAAFGLNARVRIAITGTPVENHAGDLFSIFHFLMPDLLGSYPAFGRRFGGAPTDAGGAARRSLRHVVQPFLLRRTKAQVLDDLPPLTEIEHTVTLSEAEAVLYEAVRKKALTKLGSASKDPKARLQVLAEITRLRRLCCHPQLVVPEANIGSSKLASFIELVSELIESRHRVLVFSQFVDMLGLAKAMLDERGMTYQYLDGSTPPKQRAAAVAAFQAGEGDVFLISLRAGGFGLNLTGADYVVHLDPWWNPAVESQASNRAHRIGQTRPVTVYRLVTAGTVEKRIVELHRTKRDLAESLLEGTERTATLNTEELHALLESAP